MRVYIASFYSVILLCMFIMCFFVFFLLFNRYVSIYFFVTVFIFASFTSICVFVYFLLHFEEGEGEWGRVFYNCIFTSYLSE